MAQFRSLLKNRNFVLYSTGQAFSQFGDRLVQIILIGFVYQRWPGSTFQLAKIFFFTVIPSFFISPIAGVCVDKWNRELVMIVSDMLRAVLILLVPIFFIHSQNVTPIYFTIFFIFAAACFFLPARFAVIPNLVKKEEIFLANSANSIVWVTSGIAGFSLGGFMAEWIGIEKSLYVNAIVYGLSAISFIVLAYSMKSKIGAFSSGEKGKNITASLKKSFLHDLKEGLRVLLFERKIRLVVGIFFILSALMGVLYVVGVVFIQETLCSMTKYIGLFGMYLFIGVLIGSYIYGKIGDRLPRPKVIFISFILTGISISLFAIVLSLTGFFWLGSGLAFLTGLFVSPIYVSANTIIHESTESQVRGRVFSSIGIVMNIGFLVFMFLSSVLAEHIDKLWIIVSCGVCFVILGAVNILVGLKRPVTFF
jgi:DHA3 family macrolide efflux protein-like MFS transporter